MSDLGQNEESRKVELRLDAHGQGTVLLDGEDLSHRVSCIDVHAPAGGPLRVTLTMLAFDLDAQIEAENVETKEANR